MTPKYSVIIIWSAEDQAYLASVPELAGCMADGATPAEAAHNLERVISEWIETAQALGRAIPPPMDGKAQKALVERFRAEILPKPITSA